MVWSVRTISRNLLPRLAGRPRQIRSGATRRTVFPGGLLTTCQIGRARAEVDLAPEIMDDDARVDAEEVERDFQKVRVATPTLPPTASSSPARLARFRSQMRHPSPPIRRRPPASRAEPRRRARADARSSRLGSELPPDSIDPKDTWHGYVDFKCEDPTPDDTAARERRRWRRRRSSRPAIGY